ncbi:ZCCHC7 family protein [Megaselia abdita]
MDQLDDDELDNLDQDALQDLEARLYAQVHHESSVAEDIQVSESSQHQARRRFNRYWNDANPFNSGNLVSKRLANPVQIPRQAQNNLPPKEDVLLKKGPPPPEMIIPQASGNDHGQNGSTPRNVDQETEKPIEKTKDDKEKNVFVKPQSSCKLPKVPPKVKAPFAKQSAKLERAKKLEQKKKRKEQLKAKKSKKNIETIVLETSDDNDDDVLEVPVPPPPCFTIDDSSSEEEKPNSRCPSPSSSVTSDDFIGQNDRSRLLEDSRADDVELADLQDSLSSFQEAVPAPPQLKDPTEPEYRVTEPNFKAVDIYEESEQDIPDSIYQKGKKAEALEIGDSSSSLEEIPVNEDIRKTKKWRKRRASGSNKESEHQSTSDEEEGSSLIPPYIVRGIAVEKCKEAKQRRKSQSSKLSGDINSSDNEFISKLTTIASGAIPEESSEEEEESITARAIVEDVLKKAAPLPEPDPEPSPPVEPEVEDECAIPDLDDNMKAIFSKIDETPIKEEVIEELPQDDIPFIENGEEAQDKDIFDNIFKNRNKNICFGNSNPHQENVPPDFSTDKEFYHGYFGKNDGEGIGWNTEMIMFYKQSWGGETFTVNDCIEKMDPNASWKISHLDQFPKYKKKSNIKCMNCCEFGHQKSMCKKPKKPLICYMCGERGHTEPRCPNTLCLRCGHKTRDFTRSCNSCSYESRLVCPICKVKGHTIHSCPDNWRRYHATTIPNVTPNIKPQKPNKRKYCCICAQRGHIFETCRFAFRHLEYPNTAAQIKSYQKSYEDVPDATIASGYNVHYNPNLKANLHLAEHAKEKSFYGRVMKAVGLGFLLKRKHKVKKGTSSEPPRKKSKTSEVEFKKPIASTSASVKPTEHSIDEDSNYSFSEHFDSKNSSSPSTVDTADLESDKSPEAESDALPDFIPLKDDTTEEKYPEVNSFVEGTDENSEEENEPLNKDENNKDPSVPSEAKLYLTNFHSKYLLSPEGQQFLIKMSSKHDIKAKMNFTSVGYMLILFGKQANQDDFHTELLVEFKNISTKSNRAVYHNSTQMPKKTVSLVRFIRDSLEQLSKHIGNANELFNRLEICESTDSFKSFKSAEKIRRSLNMIFMGQAGLRDGNTQLQSLLGHLKVLVNEFNQIEVVTHKMREDIHENWKYIFSSEPHENYRELLDKYNSKKSNNELQKIKFDPLLMGRNAIDVSFSNEQKEKLDKPPVQQPPTPSQPIVPDVPPVENNLVIANVVKKEAKLFNRQSMDALSSYDNCNQKKPQRSNSFSHPAKVTQKPNPRFNERPSPSNQQRLNQKQSPQNQRFGQGPQNQQRFNQGTSPQNQQRFNQGQFNQNQRFNQTQNNQNPRRPNSRNVRDPSPMWSQECKRFLNECFSVGQSARNGEFLSKLSSIQEKADRGQLSYNDYRAVLQIHNVVVKNGRR